MWLVNVFIRIPEASKYILIKTISVVKCTMNALKQILTQNAFGNKIYLSGTGAIFCEP